MNQEKAMPFVKKVFLWPLILLLVCMAPFLLLTQRLAEPLGGFHAALEAGNMLTAEHFTDSPFLSPTWDGKEINLETPGLYPFLIHLFYIAHPDPLVVARTLSLLSFFGCSLMLYLIGTRIRSRRTGCIAAMLYSSLPIAVLLGRNIQGDTTALFFFLAALWLYLRKDGADAAEKLSTVSLFGPALLFALAACTDYLVWFGALAWLVWIRRTHSGKSFFADKRSRITLLLGAGIPLALYLARMMAQPSAFFDGLIGTFRVNTPFLFFRSLFLQKEFLWALSPLTALTVLAACFLYFRRKDLRHPLLTSMIVVQLLPFLFFAKYSFYLLPATPFLVLMLASVLEGLDDRGFPRYARRLCVTVLFLSGIFVSLLSVVHSKYGYTDLQQAKLLLKGSQGGDSNGIVLVNLPFYISQNKELRYYFHNDSLVPIEQAEVDQNQQFRLSNLSVRMLLRPFTREGATMKVIKRTEYIADFYGYGLQIEKSPHFFQFDSWKTIGDLPRFPFYIHPLEEIPTLELSLHPQNTRVFRQGDKLIFRDN